MGPGRRVTAAIAAMTLTGQVDPPDVEAPLEVLASAEQAADSPGCVLGIRVGAAAVTRAFGLSSIEHAVPNGPRTIFHAGSIAKQFTATAILMLEAEGKLSLEDPLTQLVPELAASASAVRIRHLLEHSSGIRDYGELLLIAGGLDTGPITREGVLDLLARQRQLNFLPGTRFSYSGSGYFLAALIVERASGQALADFAAERIFGPLGMTGTRFLADRSAVLPNRAQGYRRAPQGEWQRAEYLSDAYGDGGLFTTVEDMLRWTDNLRTGEVGGRPLVRRLAEPTRLSTGETVAWGLGLEVRSDRHGASLSHGGRDFGFHAYQLFYPQPNVAAIVLCNGRELDPYRLAGTAIAPALPPAASQARAAEAAEIAQGEQTMAAEADPQRYVGTYYNPRTLAVRRIELRGRDLFWPRGSGFVLEPRGRSRFRLAEQPVMVTFSAFDGGTPQRMTVANVGPGAPPPGVYQRMEPPHSDLDQYSGTYWSDETGTQYRVSPAANGRLRFRANPSFALIAAPQFRDAFSVGEDLIFRFHRHRGRISGLTISTDRARDIGFAKR